MVKGQANLCGQCKVNCGSNSVFCSFCSSWFHAKCEQLSPKEVSVLAKANRGYICSSCSDDNFEMSLARITEAATCYSNMEKIVKRESVIMRKPFVVNDELPTIHVYFQRSIDTVSRRLQEKYDFMLERRPLFVSGDGNCLFNAVSVALSGSQRLAAELRVRTVIEMVTNAEKYKGSPNAKTYLTLAPNYKDACVECGKNGAYSSVWTMVALTSVIGRPIHSVYPPCNGTEGSNGFIYRSLNTTFLPDKNCRSQPVYIMWTSTLTNRPKGSWSPNHFVPLLALTDVPGIPALHDQSVPQTNFSSLSPTYHQDFPDLSSSLELGQSPKRQKLSKSPVDKFSKLPKQSDNSYLQEGDSSGTAKMNSTPINYGNQGKTGRPNIVLTPLERNVSVSLNRNIATPEGQALNELEESVTVEPSRINNACSSIQGECEAENKTDHVCHYPEENIEYVTEPSSEDHPKGSEEECDTGNQNETISDSEPDTNENLKPMKGLNAKQIFNIVMNQRNVLPSVPKGLKSNCYFVVDNEENVKKTENNENCEYHDDCGAWDSEDTRTLDTAYVLRNGNLQHIRKKEDIYCTKKRVSGKEVWKPVEPQPDENDVVVLHKYYTSLKRSSAFTKRVSWFKKLPSGNQEKLLVSVIEYIGTYPDAMSVHGHTKIKNKQYVRTDPDTKQKIKEKLMHNVPVRKIFKDLQKEDHESAPRDYKAIKYLKQKERKNHQTSPQAT